VLPTPCGSKRRAAPHLLLRAHHSTTQHAAVVSLQPHTKLGRVAGRMQSTSSVATQRVARRQLRLPRCTTAAHTTHSLPHSLSLSTYGKRWAGRRSVDSSQAILISPHRWRRYIYGYVKALPPTYYCLSARYNKRGHRCCHCCSLLSVLKSRN